MENAGAAPNTTVGAADVGLGALAKSGDLLPNVAPELSAAGTALSRVGGFAAVTVSGAETAYALGNHDYGDAGFGLADTVVDALLTAAGPEGVAVAGVYQLAGGSKAIAAGALSATCAVSGLL